MLGSAAENLDLLQISLVPNLLYHFLLKKLAPFQLKVSRNRTKGYAQRAEGQKDLALRADLRSDKSEAVDATPPAIGIAIAGAQPATTVIAVRREEGRITAGVLDELVHGNDPHQPHGLDLLVRKLVADQAGNLGVGGGQLALASLSTDLLGDAVTIVEEHALQDSNVVGDAGSRLEILGAEELLGVIADAISLGLQVGDPLGTGLAVRGDSEIDDAVLLAPGAVGIANHCPSVEDVPDCLMIFGIGLPQLGDVLSGPFVGFQGIHELMSLAFGIGRHVFTPYFGTCAVYASGPPELVVTARKYPPPAGGTVAFGYGYLRK